MFLSFWLFVVDVFHCCVYGLFRCHDVRATKRMRQKRKVELECIRVTGCDYFFFLFISVYFYFRATNCCIIV